MSVNLTIAGTTYAFPTVGENNWGQVVTNWATAVSTYLLQRTGGSFSLTNEVDFGANFATKQAYIKSRTANPASAGFGRLARADVVSWRNQLNNGNLDLGVDSANNLTWNGVIIPTSAALLTANRALVSNGSGLISVSAVTATQLGYVSGVTSAIQTQLDGKQTSGSYITALTGDVTASGPGSAAATIGANKVTNAMLAQVATAIFKGRTTAATGNVEDLTVTQATALLNAMVGDTGSGGTKGLVPAPATGDAAKCLSGAATWVTVNPMTTGGDVIYGGASGALTRLANGSLGQVLTSAGGTSAPTWGYPGFNYIAKATGYGAVANDFVNCTGSSFTVTLPTAVGIAGKRIAIGMGGATLVTVATTSSQTVGGLSGSTIKLGTTKDCLVVVSDGANWQIQSLQINNSVQATLSTSTTGISSSTIIFNNVVSDPLGQYNNSNGLVTIQVPGTYLINARAVFASLDGATDASLFLRPNGANTYQFYGSRLAANGAAGATAALAIMVTLSAGDTVGIFANGDASFDLDSNGARTFFELVRMGN